MAQLTQAQVLAYNKKVTAAKDKALQDKFRKDLAEKELTRTCEELTELLGKPITPENLELEYATFVGEAMQTMESGTKILAGLEKDQADALSTVSTSKPPAYATTYDQAVPAKQVDLDLDALLDL